MQIVIDCCLTTDWEPILKTAGFDVVHWRNIGPIQASDIEIARWAAANDHVVLTQDLDYGACPHSSVAFEVKSDWLVANAAKPSTDDADWRR
ncbi:MAG: DUF5615 family PIN-like protein [Planctomycetes bacterium]|nr:DUF5615 family PIN-like protein [Planctomycetota bacterium]